MLLVTGESRFADLFERTLYNGFLSGLSLDGESFFYANPLQSRTGAHRHRWNQVACCPPNIMRLLASLHHYLATVTDDGIQLHQYASSRIRAGDVVLSVETAYPWDGTVRVEVVESHDREWTLALRIPGWAREATLDGWRQSEYRDLRALPAATAASPTQLLAVPYFAWANRSGGAMRVWIPAAEYPAPGASPPG
jgi:hypothetical protein